MGAQEDYAAALDHENYVRSQTNDREQIANAQANTQRMQARLNSMQTGQTQANKIAESNPLYDAAKWLMGSK